MAEENVFQGIYLFKAMSVAEIEIIRDSAEMKSYSDGEDVFCQDDIATALYIIKDGSVRIHQKAQSGDNIEVAVLGSGSHFGEMAFVDGENRSATATSIETTKIIMMSYNRLSETLNKNPEIAVKFFQALAHFLCGRLRVTTNDLSFARERNLRFF